MNPYDKHVVAACMGALSAMHTELQAVDLEVDPALCSIEDAFGVLNELLTGLTGPEAIAVSL